MTIRETPAFTPEVLISAQRTSPGIPSPSGTYIVFSESSYSFETQNKSSAIGVLDLSTRQTSLLTDDKKCSNPVWLADDTIALLRSADEDVTELVIGPPADFKSKSYVAGSIDGPADNLKVTPLFDGRFGVAVTGLAKPDGSIYNPSKAPKPRSSGRLYSSLYVRHWDRWINPQRNAIFYGALMLSSSTEYYLSPVTNALKGTALESPIPTFGGTDHFDISCTGLVFVSKDPVLDPAGNTKCNIYYISLTNFLEITPTMYSVKIDGIEGAMTSPVFSKDGKQIAFLAMAQNGYESDQNQILVMRDVGRPASVEKLIDEKIWTLSPQGLAWSNDSSTLYFTAETSGNKCLFGTPVAKSARNPAPRLLVAEGFIDDFHILPDPKDRSTPTHQLFLSSSSLTVPREFAVVAVPVLSTTVAANNNQPEVQTIITHFPTQHGLKSTDISKIYTPAACPSLLPQTDGKVESWVIKPPNFDPSKRYPLCLLIHGGPQGAWLNAWSTRWNPLVFAAQGYVVVTPNVTGSTGYGQAFVDGINQQWGGRPYEDLVNVFDWIAENLSYVDAERAVALGASYGGYMVNWINGHPLGRKFKALVCHDGMFSVTYEQATDELYFIRHDLGGKWSDGPKTREKWEQWDPALFTEHWATPQLVIHSEKDFRLTISDGLAAFNTLQEKGVESQFLTFPDENHFVLNEENSLVWHETVLAWINDRVGLPRWRSKYREGEESDVVMDPKRPAEAEAEASSSDAVRTTGGNAKVVTATESLVLER